MKLANLLKFCQVFTANHHLYKDMRYIISIRYKIQSERLLQCDGEI